MKTIQNILDIKGSDVYVTEPESLVIDAVKKMAEKKVGALIVLDKENIKGVVTEQDFTRRVLLKDLDTNLTTVQQVMSQDVAMINPQQNVNEGLQLMTDRHIRHLPVVEDNKLVGIISIGDLVKEALNNLVEFWQRQVFKFEALILSIVILWFKSITKKLETWLSPVG